jgi:uncharacterized repeat protein (TIGR01451 family)
MIGFVRKDGRVHARRTPMVLFAFATAIGLAGSSAVLAKGVPGSRPVELQTAFTQITSAGPLDNIFLGVDIAAQIGHTGDSSYEVYPPGTTPADYGTFLVVADTLYAPDMAGHGGTASGSIGTYTAFTPISQSAIGGSGTSGAPFTVTTVVGVGATGLTITQVDSYVIGQESYRTDVSVANSGGAPVSAILYRAMDCFLGGSDSGYGMLNGTAVGCSANPNNVPAGRIEQIVPLTAGNNYYQSFYGSVWAAIGTHLPFPNTCDCTVQQDNGAGISWNITVPAGGSVTYSNITVFSPTGAQALFVTKTADVANVQGGDSDGYTITVNNPGADATLSSIVDTLPAGFTYTAGSSTGVTTADPSAAGQVLTWTGPFAIAAGGSVSLHFGVTVSSVSGTYTNQVTADAGAAGIADSGPTAPITVGGVAPPAGPISTPTLGEGMLALLALLLVAMGVFAGRRVRG